MLFLGIFVTMVPALHLLEGWGKDGTISIHSPWQFFWATGLLSSFLDNAPTYLVFFNTAGGDAATLMTAQAATLGAISAGAVYMGANSYIGNAPNLMVKAIAESRGVRMPGFFGYMAWSASCLIPLFVLLTLVFIR